MKLAVEEYYGSLKPLLRLIIQLRFEEKRSQDEVCDDLLRRGVEDTRHDRHWLALREDEIRGGLRELLRKRGLVPVDFSNH